MLGLVPSFDSEVGVLVIALLAAVSVYLALAEAFGNTPRLLRSSVPLRWTRTKIKTRTKIVGQVVVRRFLLLRVPGEVVLFIGVVGVGLALGALHQVTSLEWKVLAASCGYAIAAAAAISIITVPRPALGRRLDRHLEARAISLQSAAGEGSSSVGEMDSVR